MTTFTWRDFPAPNVGAVTREVGTVWLVYPTILPELAKGETDDLGYATKRLVPIFCTLFLPDPNLAWGGARWEKRENRGKKFGTCWEIRVIPGAGSMGLVLGQTGAAYPR